MRILFAHPGLHRYDRGSEIAFISIARELTRLGGAVTLIGSGLYRSAESYRFLRAPCVSRERFKSFPSIPIFRTEFTYEELTFACNLLRCYRPADHDVTVACSYPFTNWSLRRPTILRKSPRHVFVTQNGDWPAQSKNSEYRLFRCDGLICTNPDFYERNKNRWRCILIPNGVNCELFTPGQSSREEFDLPPDKKIVLMVSALYPRKRVNLGIEAIHKLDNVHLVVAGDGPLRPELELQASRLLPGRFTCLSIPSERMPTLYRSADVLLHLAREESFGNIFVEALACGLPIVAQDSLRVRWIVGDTEFLVDTADVNAIAEGIDAALDSPPSRQAHRVARAKTFSWPRIGEMYHSFLQQVVNSA